MTYVNPTGVEASMRTAQRLAQPTAKQYGVVLRGAYTTEDAAYDQDDNPMTLEPNPDTGGGNEPGNNVIQCVDPSGRVLWTITEWDVVRLGGASGNIPTGEALGRYLERLLGVLPGPGDLIIN